MNDGLMVVMIFASILCIIIAYFSGKFEQKRIDLCESLGYSEFDYAYDGNNGVICKNSDGSFKYSKVVS